MKKKLLVALASIAIAVPAFSSPIAEGNTVLTTAPLQINGLFFGGDAYDDKDFGDDGEIKMALTEGPMQLEYFVMDAVSLGGLVQLQYPMDSDAEMAWRFGLVGTYYHDLGTGMMPFVTAGLSYADIGETAVEGPKGPIAAEGNITSIFIQPGVSMMITDNVAAYGALDMQYNIYDTEDVGTGATLVDDDGFQLGLNVGVKAFF